MPVALDHLEAFISILANSSPSLGIFGIVFGGSIPSPSILVAVWTDLYTL